MAMSSSGWCRSFCAVLVVALLVAIVAVTWHGSAEARHTFGFGFLTGTAWNPVKGQYGALPAIYGTVVSSAIALLIAGPLGVLIAIFLAELCRCGCARRSRS